MFFGVSEGPVTVFMGPRTFAWFLLGVIAVPAILIAAYMIDSSGYQASQQRVAEERRIEAQKPIDRCDALFHAEDPRYAHDAVGDLRHREAVYGECRFPVSSCSEFNIALQDRERVQAMVQFGTWDRWRRQCSS
jgi:hypothetical protein